MVDIKNKLCSVCGKRKVRFVTTTLYSYDYGFCGKVCLANHAIKKYKLKELKEAKQNDYIEYL